MIAPLRGQSNAIVEYNGIVFEKGVNDKLKEEYAFLCSEYIKSNYSKKKLPLIYIVVDNQSTNYELAYDNLTGNSLDNKLYERKGKFYKPGIRIKVPVSPNQSDAILKLLDYGILHLCDLKKNWRKVSKLDYYDRPESLSLNEEKIKEILKKVNASK